MKKVDRRCGSPEVLHGGGQRGQFCPQGTFGKICRLSGCRPGRKGRCCWHLVCRGQACRTHRHRAGPTAQDPPGHKVLRWRNPGLETQGAGATSGKAAGQGDRELRSECHFEKGQDVSSGQSPRRSKAEPVSAVGPAPPSQPLTKRHQLVKLPGRAKPPTSLRAAPTSATRSWGCSLGLGAWGRDRKAGCFHFSVPTPKVPTPFQAQNRKGVRTGGFSPG